MESNQQRENAGGRWQDESLTRDVSGRQADEKEARRSDCPDNPEHMESPDTMANPQSNVDVGRKQGEEEQGDEGDRESRSPCNASKQSPKSDTGKGACI